LLKEIEKLGSKPINAPIDGRHKLNTKEGKPLDDVQQFQRIIEKLMYLTVIRPDIAFLVSQISQFMHAPKTSHLDAITRVLRYLKGTLRKGIWMQNNNSNTMCGLF
jgi:hypothetical protein